MQSRGRFFRLTLFVAGTLCCGVFGGCPSSTKVTPAKAASEEKHDPLVLLVVDDPKLGQTIAREWRGVTEEQLAVRDVSLSEMVAATRLPGDAIIFPSGLIGHLAERGLIVPLEGTALED